jgi:hypothetical protein
MLACSPAFTAAAAAGIRKPKARVTIVWTDPFIDPSITTESSSLNRVSYPEQVADLIEDVPYKWAHCDGQTPLSAGLHPAPGSLADARDRQMGWWSAGRSGADGVVSPEQELSISFTARPVFSLRVAGDDAWGESPVDFSVLIYSGASLLARVDVEDNDDQDWTHDVSSAGITAADKIVLIVSKWSHASRVVKIAEFYTSIATRYDGDEIMSMTITEERDTKDGTLPIGNVSANEIDLKLNNTDDKFFPGNTDAPLHTLVKKNRRIIAELGFELPDGTTEYMPMGVFWSGDWQTSEMGTDAATSGRDRMEALRKSSFYAGEVYENTNLKALAEIVLLDAKTLMPDLEYSVADELESFTIPWAWLEKQSHFDALKKIATACMGYAYCDRLGVVQILGPTAPSGASVLQITADNYFDRNQPANSEDIANRIEVTTAPLVPATVADTVYESQEEITIAAGQTVVVECKYQGAPVIEAVATTIEAGDAVPSDAEYYAWGAIVSVYSATGDTCKIKIVGKKFEVVGAETVVEEGVASIREFGVQAYKFPESKLIQSRDIAETITATLLPVYSTPSKDTNLDWRGHPALELGDAVTVPEYGSTTADFYITRQTHTYDGTYKAKLDGRKAENITGNYQDTDGAVAKWQDTDAALKIQE